MKLSQKTWIALGAAAGLLCLTCAGGLITIGLQLRRVVSRQAPARSSEPSSGGGETKPTTTTKADQTLIKLYIKQIASTRIQTNDSLPSETGYAIDALGEIGPDAKEAIPTLANFIRQRQRFDFGGSDCARTVRSLRWMGAFDTLESLMFDGSVKNTDVRRAVLADLLDPEQNGSLEKHATWDAMVARVRAARRGEPTAYDTMYDSYKPKVGALLQRAAADPDFAQTVVDYWATRYPPDIDNIITLMRNPNANIRAEAADFLAIGRGRHQIRSVVGYSTRPKREYAKAIPALTALLDDPNEQVRMKAAKTLSELRI